MGELARCAQIGDEFRETLVAERALGYAQNQ